MLIKVEEPEKPVLSDNGLGVDLGIKKLAVTSDNEFFKNINKTKRVRDIKKSLKREQRRLSRKYESLKKRSKNIKKGKATRQNIQKQKLKVAKLYEKLERIRTDYINKCICKLVKAKPAYITIENLAVRNMMKNRYLAGSIAEQKLSEFRTKLTKKANEAGIEIRIVSRWYPSSKTCHNCGFIRHDLTLKDRTFNCPCCGTSIDRDYNAALNLRDATEYKVDT